MSKKICNKTATPRTAVFELFKTLDGGGAFSLPQINDWLGCIVHATTARGCFTPSLGLSESRPSRESLVQSESENSAAGVHPGVRFDLFPESNNHRPGTEEVSPPTPSLLTSECSV